MSPFRSGLTSSSSLLLAASARNKVKMRSFMSSPVRFQDPVHRYRDPQTRQFFLTFRRLAMAISTFLGLGLIYSYAPPFRTTTREGRAFDQYLQSKLLALQEYVTLTGTFRSCNGNTTAYTDTYRQRTGRT